MCFETALNLSRHGSNNHLFRALHEGMVVPHELLKDRPFRRVVRTPIGVWQGCLRRHFCAEICPAVDLFPQLEEKLSSSSAVRASTASLHGLKLTKSSPHISMAPARYFALTSALHSRCTPSTPAVSFLPSVLLSPAPRAPGTARSRDDDNVSKASKEEDIRP